MRSSSTFKSFLDHYDTVGKKLLELGFSGTAVNSGWRRHLFEDAVAVIGSFAVTERSCEIDAFGSDVLLIALLPVEVDDVFDGPKVT